MRIKNILLSFLYFVPNFFANTVRAVNDTNNSYINSSLHHNINLNKNLIDNNPNAPKNLQKETVKFNTNQIQIYNKNNSEDFGEDFELDDPLIHQPELEYTPEIIELINNIEDLASNLPDKKSFIIDIPKIIVLFQDRVLPLIQYHSFKLIVPKKVLTSLLEFYDRLSKVLAEDKNNSYILSNTYSDKISCWPESYIRLSVDEAINIFIDQTLSNYEDIIEKQGIFNRIVNNLLTVLQRMPGDIPATIKSEPTAIAQQQQAQQQQSDLVLAIRDLEQFNRQFLQSSKVTYMPQNFASKNFIKLWHVIQNDKFRILPKNEIKLLDSAKEILSSINYLYKSKSANSFNIKDELIQIQLIQIQAWAEFTADISNPKYGDGDMVFFCKKQLEKIKQLVSKNVIVIREVTKCSIILTALIFAVIKASKKQASDQKSNSTAPDQQPNSTASDQKSNNVNSPIEYNNSNTHEYNKKFTDIIQRIQKIQDLREQVKQLTKECQKIIHAVQSESLNQQRNRNNKSTIDDTSIHRMELLCQQVKQINQEYKKIIGEVESKEANQQKTQTIFTK